MPLYKYLKTGPNPDLQPKNCPIELDEEAKVAFRKLRKALTEAPILAYPQFDSDKPFTLATDFSNDPGAIGAVLSQEQDGHERVIAYAARKLTNSEKHYSSYKGEMLAGVYFMKHFRYYLQLRPFVWIVDCKALLWLHAQMSPCGMTLRWIEAMSSYQFKVVFRKGSQNLNADACSRAEHAREPTKEDIAESEVEAMYSMVNALSDQKVISALDLKLAQERDADLGHVISWIKQGEKPLKSAVRAHGSAVQQYWGLFEVLQLSPEGVLVRLGHPDEATRQDRPCLPESLLKQVLEMCHRGSGGHMGIQTTKHRFIQRFYRPGR
jgi:hypothetical protein